MSQPSLRIEPPYRPEFEYPLSALAPATGAEQLRKPLTLTHRLLNHDGVRKLLILALLAVLWELIGRWQDNELLLPTFSATMQAMWTDLLNGELPARAWQSLRVLVQGYAAGVLLAFGLTTLAVSTQFGRDLLSTLTSMFNPLPAIALLPLALLWFGLGQGSLIFVLVHSVLWPLALNTYAGFLGVSETLRMAGRNYGLTGLRYVLQILVPAALPAILSGLKIGWAFAWRTLIAAELASILKMAENNITPDKVLRDIGLDSLMAMELGTSFQQKTGIDLPLSSISDNTTVGAIVGKLREKLLSRQPQDTNDDAVDDLLEGLANRHGVQKIPEAAQ